MTKNRRRDFGRRRHFGRAFNQPAPDSNPARRFSIELQARRRPFEPLHLRQQRAARFADFPICRVIHVQCAVCDSLISIWLRSSGFSSKRVTARAGRLKKASRPARADDYLNWKFGACVESSLSFTTSWRHFPCVIAGYNPNRLSSVSLTCCPACTHLPKNAPVASAP